MIPAILAAPMVQGVIGSVVGGVMSAFSPSTPTPPEATSSSPFAAQLARAATTLQNNTAASSNAGTMRSTEWSQMSDTGAHTWLQSLSGRHVDATDASGRTISGVVNGVQFTGNHLSLTIGNQNVPLSSLKQISWSTATV